MQLSGTGVPMVTPFDAGGRLRPDAAAAVAEWLVDQGVEFVLACGSTGEAPMLGPEERVRVVESVAGAVEVPVLAGTGYPSLALTRRTTDAAADAGADAALVVTPYYYRHDAAALRAYYRAVADAAPVPVYLYSVPTYTGVTLAPETVADLAEHPNVAGIKDTGGDLAALRRTVRATPPDFSVLVGSGDLYGPGLDAGADGGILALCNAVPERATAVYRRHRAGDRTGARALTGDLADLNRAITARYGVPGTKAALDHRGVDAGHPRAPFRPLDDAARAEVGDLVDAALAAGDDAGGDGP